MPWFTLKHQAEEGAAFADKYNVSGIPKLVIINADGNLITENGKSDVLTLGMKAYDAWLTPSKK